MAIVRRTLKQIRESFDVDKFDWSKFDATTEEDIDRQIALDPDTAPEATDADLARARRVYPPDFVDVRAVRARLGLSQAAFAARFGFRLRTVQEWEQGRRRPEGPARTLLKLIDRAPEVVDRLLAAEEEPAAPRQPPR